MNTDIKPYTGLNLWYQLEIEPRRLELAEHLGTIRKIEVKEPETLLLPASTFDPSKCFVCGRKNCNECDESDYYEN